MRRLLCVVLVALAATPVLAGVGDANAVGTDARFAQVTANAQYAHVVWSLKAVADATLALAQRTGNHTAELAVQGLLGLGGMSLLSGILTVAYMAVVSGVFVFRLVSAALGGSSDLPTFGEYLHQVDAFAVGSWFAPMGGMNAFFLVLALPFAAEQGEQAAATAAEIAARLAHIQHQLLKLSAALQAKQGEFVNNDEFMAAHADAVAAGGTLQQTVANSNALAQGGQQQTAPL